MTTSAPLRTAIIGYGLGGRVFHAPLIAADPAYALVAIVTGDAERGAEAAERYGEGVVVRDADALFARASELDLVVITTPNDTHAALAHRALDAGLDVVVDKPFALTAAEALEVIAHAEQVGRAVTVYQNRRWDGDFLTVQALIGSGELGEVRQFESAFEFYRPERGAKWKDRVTAEQGGGILYDLGPHLIDQAVRLFGPVDLEHGVHAELDVRRQGGLADDDSFVTLQHEGGVRSRLWMSAVSPANRPRFRVVGADAVLETHGLDPQERQALAGMLPGDPAYGLDPEAQTAVVRTPDGGAREVAIERGSHAAFYRELASGLTAASDASTAALPVLPVEAEHVLRIIEAAHRSAR
ncbi:Gfo/Idh/MocA family oxidoreductase [Herbiconiux sp. CPCC 203407]|uniref:Gfo/Idh/MocA family oxidoreductase n=1 Tax=Herbiconiux oxytropis TaxID=2970915 RepID=A0AA41XKK1_9MICO|nr:Gfo/Idh/MocA family oxidoreductase [Herbiconiux oxytropis]MCS5723332.1 Gfo/Idh/MocA family oxidoreductase [Herbiconiux oxytropis]MCS5727511.1 Gfo/Idh/MocA family oxidoreductase [Herbiconiux oxytropis]